jgi:hypothetical protein
MVDIRSRQLAQAIAMATAGIVRPPEARESLPCRFSPSERRETEMVMEKGIMEMETEMGTPMATEVIKLPTLRSCFSAIDYYFNDGQLLTPSRKFLKDDGQDRLGGNA